MCTAEYTQHQYTHINCLTRIQVLNKPYHPLRRSFIAWGRKIVEDKITATITFDIDWLIPNEPSLLTRIVDLNNTVTELDPTQALINPISGGFH